VARGSFATASDTELSAFIEKTLETFGPASLVSIEHRVQADSGPIVADRYPLSREVLEVVQIALRAWANTRVREGSEEKPESYLQAPAVAQMLGVKTDVGEMETAKARAERRDSYQQDDRQLPALRSERVSKKVERRNSTCR
jgi:hypothetical protein